MEEKKKHINWGPIIEQMKVGDSILCPDQSKADCLGIALRKRGSKPMNRQQSDGTTIRVWRIA